MIIYSTREQLARKLFKSTIQPTSSLHNLLPLLGTIDLSLDYEVPQNFQPVSPPEPKCINPFSPIPSPTIMIDVSFYLLYVFVCVFQHFYLVYYSAVATTSNKHIAYVYSRKPSTNVKAAWSV